MYTYILLTMLITDQYNQLAAFYCIKKTVGPTSIDSLKLYCNLDKGDCFVCFI